MEKLFLTYDQIHETTREIAADINRDGFDFDFMIAIGTGGFIPARILKTFIDKPIITVGMAYYDLDNNKMESPIVVQWLDDPVNQIKGRKILVVDEVDDTRRTIGYCLERLLRHDPKEIAAAVLHDKKKPKIRKVPESVKRYYRGDVVADRWICYPWEATDIREHNRRIETP